MSDAASFRESEAVTSTRPRLFPIIEYEGGGVLASIREHRGAGRRNEVGVPSCRPSRSPVYGRSRQHVGMSPDPGALRCVSTRQEVKEYPPPCRPPPVPPGTAPSPLRDGKLMQTPLAFTYAAAPQCGARLPPLRISHGLGSHLAPFPSLCRPSRGPHLALIISVMLSSH